MKNIFITLLTIALLTLSSVAFAAGCPLCGAVIDGNLSEVKRLLDNGANVNGENKNGWTALEVAARYNQIKTVKLLLENEVNVNYKNKDGWTALMRAAEYGQRDIAKVLLANGANVHYEDKHGRTALIIAAYKGQYKVVRILLEYGANPDIEDNNRYNAWYYAQGKPIVLAVLNKHLEDFVNKNNHIAGNVYEKTWRSVVLIKANSKQGSGVIIKPEIVATNCHVVKNGNIQVYKAEKRQTNLNIAYTAKIIKQDNINDFCLLSVKGLQGIPATVRKYDTISEDEEVYGLGAPKGLDLSLSKGIVSKLRKKNGKRFIQTDAAISPGSSGGGLFDSEGKLIGIMTWKISEDHVEGIGFAIPADLAL